MKIYRIIPLDSKGEQDGNEVFTCYEQEAAKAFAEGHSVMVGEVSSWSTVGIMPATKAGKPINWYDDKGQYPIYGRD